MTYVNGAGFPQKGKQFALSSLIRRGILPGHVSVPDVLPTPYIYICKDLLSEVLTFFPLMACSQASLDIAFELPAKGRVPIRNLVSRLLAVTRSSLRGAPGRDPTYSDRRKFRRSCLSEADRLLKFVITPLASDPQECVLAAGEKALVVPVVRGNLTVKLWLSAVSKQIVESL
jgi:hypothetical protein